jgi:TetR/AcrR family transcriptional regulator, regulator of cefoperazone and chloramphenicol sensitivity
MDDTREKLLAAASRVFAERGFEKATVREICQAAGISNLAAVNYYFGDKERLYIEAVKLAHRTRIAEVPLPVWGPDTKPEDKFRGLVLTMANRIIAESSQPWHEQLMMREFMQPTAAVAELVQEFFRPHFSILSSVIRELVPADTTEAELHRLAFSVVGQCLHYRVARPIVNFIVGPDEAATLTPDLLAQHIAEFSLAALTNWKADRGSAKQRAGAAKQGALS